MNGGWNLDNVDVKVVDANDADNIVGTFVPSTGSYSLMTYGDSFESDLYDTSDSNQGTVLVKLHGKDWPVGEPVGVKVIEGNSYDATLSRNRPASCIMTTSYLEGAYLDSDAPSQTLCNSAFQTHKRFKFNMLPAMVSTLDEERYGTGVNMTFNVVPDENTWRYLVLQKINNYTGRRLDGFKIEVGFTDANGNFTKASESAGADLRLSVGVGENIKNGEATDIWDANQLATFSHGLFGPQTYEEPVPHFATDGFFDNRRAGFTVALNEDNDTIGSTGTLGSNYMALPVPYGAVSSQFGSWLPSEWAPEGIFWDDDNDPTTDASLVAFWGDRGDGTYVWMKGDATGFQAATAAELLTWASNPTYALSEIEDVLNLGLNYIVEIGDVSTFPVTTPASTVTVRITPRVAENQDAPGYVSTTAPSLSTYIGRAGSVEISPAPRFTAGTELSIVVVDSDLNLDPSVVDTIVLSVTTSLGETELVTLSEIGVDRGVFTAVLPTSTAKSAAAVGNGIIQAKPGTLVSVSYTDEDNGVSGKVVLTATTRATGNAVPLPVKTPKPIKEPKPVKVTK